MNASLDTAIVWQPLGPAWLLAALGLAVAAWTIISYRREAASFSPARCAVLAALRLTALLILLAMLAQPALERRHLGKSRIVVLVDRSASMATADVAVGELSSASPSTQDSSERIGRLAAAIQLLGSDSAAIVPAVGNAYDVQLFAFAAATEPLATTALAELMPAEPTLGTHLGDVVAASLSGGAAPPTAVIVLTDGIVTAGRSLADAAQRARALGTPLFAVAIGSDRPRPDVAVDDVLVEDIVFPGDRLQIEANVRAIGYAGQSAVASLVIGEETVASTTIEFTAEGEPVAVRLTWRPTEPGPVDAAVVVEPFADEADRDNNRAAFHVDVRSEPVRVLLAQSSPSFEFRALKSLLERDPAIRLSAYLQEADAEFADVDEAAVNRFPLEPGDFADYDVLIVGDLDPGLLPRGAWEQVLEFVADEGGGLAVIAGPQFMSAAYGSVRPLQTLLPLASTSFNPLRDGGAANVALQIVPTPAGIQQAMFQLGADARESARIWQALPPVYWALAPVKLRPGAETLAVFRPTIDDPPVGFTSSPAIVRQFVGAGEVLLHLTDETWRWRWRNDDRYFARYWGQAVRRLARGRIGRGAAKISTDRTAYDAGDVVQIRAVLRGAATTGGRGAPTAIVVGGGAAPRRVVLTRRADSEGVYEATVADLPPDRYEVRLVDRDQQARPARFEIVAPPGELTQLAVAWDALVQAAETSGGHAYRVADASRLVADLPPPTPTVLEQLPPEPIWNRWWAIGTLCLALVAEWFIRRRTGML
ncbi:MAG: hypothetical protein KDA44_04085 [Planctomycetales bacterium]|nr:hypothetical protein [Planctomycetales bacterium]